MYLWIDGRIDVYYMYHNVYPQEFPFKRLASSSVPADRFSRNHENSNIRQMPFIINGFSKQKTDQDSTALPCAQEKRQNKGEKTHAGKENSTSREL